MIRVVIADDHAIFRQGLKQILHETPEFRIDGEAGSQAELLQVLQGAEFDVLVLDISMPDSNGLETLRKVKADYPRLNILVLSMYSLEQYALRALKSGAKGYITKECAPAQITEAVLKVSRGERFLTPEVAELLATEVLKGSESVAHPKLSEREMETLTLLGQGKTVKDIAQIMSVSIKTVSTYRTRLLEKLGLSTTSDLIRYAIDLERSEKAS